MRGVTSSKARLAGGECSRDPQGVAHQCDGLSHTQRTDAQRGARGKERRQEPGTKSDRRSEGSNWSRHFVLTALQLPGPPDAGRRAAGAPITRVCPWLAWPRTRAFSPGLCGKQGGGALSRGAFHSSPDTGLRVGSSQRLGKSSRTSRLCPKDVCAGPSLRSLRWGSDNVRAVVRR